MEVAEGLHALRGRPVHGTNTDAPGLGLRYAHMCTSPRITTVRALDALSAPTAVPWPTHNPMRLNHTLMTPPPAPPVGSSVRAAR